MNILALDSALSACSAAVVRDGVILAEIFEERARGQAERLIPMCQEVCGQAGLSFEGLEAIAVTCGPGTFTGVRIGLAAAKGLALALNIPLVGVTTLDVVARNIARSIWDGRVAVALDARRSEVYLQIFEVKDGHNIPVSDPAAVPLSNVAAHLDGQVTALFGTGAELVKPFLSADMCKRLDFPDVSCQPKGGTLGLMAWERLASCTTPEAVVPLYLRAPDAVAAKAIRYPFQNL